jgi:hypothetical protein
MALWNIIAFCLGSSLWGKNGGMTMAAAFSSNVDLQDARTAEAAFLQELHDALRMDEKSPAIHNWFRSNTTTATNTTTTTTTTSSSICGFTGVQCGVNGLITILDLSSKGLEGTVPSSFATLTQLQRLLLRNNNIDGNLPWRLPETLVHFNVDRNRLQGPIPSLEFATSSSSSDSSPSDASPQLERLILSENLLEGSLPMSICALGQLKALNLSRNPGLQGTLPECLADLTKLKGLQVLGTHIVGPILPSPQSERPSDAPSLVPSIATSRVPTGLPSSPPTDAPQEATFSKAPTTSNEKNFNNKKPTLFRSSTPPWKLLKISSASNDLVPSNSPTLRPSGEYADRSEETHAGIQSQEERASRQERAFYDQTVFLPVFVLLCMMGLVGSLLAIPSIRTELQRRQRTKAFSALTGGGPADDATPCGDEELLDDEEEISFSKDAAWCGGGLDDLLEAGVNSSSVGDCGEYGCHVSDSPFAASSADTSPTIKPRPSNQVTSRPCIVRPQTVAANPKVHFLLLARSLSSVEDESQDPVASQDEDLSIVSSPNTMDTHSEPKNTTRTVFSSTMESLLCAPVCMMPNNRRGIPLTNGTSNSILEEQDEMWTFSPSPAKSRLGSSREDAFDRSDIGAASSSLSSTTPMLNPIASLKAKMAPLSRRLPIAPSRHAVDKDAHALIAEYARKYFPDEASAAPPPPVDQVDCFPDADVSFSLSASQDGSAHEKERPTTSNTTGTGRPRPGDLTSFRPPRFYKKNPTSPPAPGPRITDEDRTHSVLGIRSPYADHQSDDEYEIEVLEYPQNKMDPPEVNGYP